VKIPTPEGKVDLKIPHGSGSGRKLRLKGRGIPASTTGDLYAVIQLVTPPATSERDKALYHQMEQEMKFNPRKRLGV
jgi:curved DNA-binding protein